MINCDLSLAGLECAYTEFLREFGKAPEFLYVVPELYSIAKTLTDPEVTDHDWDKEGEGVVNWNNVTIKQFKHLKVKVSHKWKGQTKWALTEYDWIPYVIFGNE